MVLRLMVSMSGRGTPMKWVLLRVMALLVLGLWTAFAMAAEPIGPQILDDHNLDLPIDIIADRLRVDQTTKVAIFEGSVQAQQGDLVFNASELRVFYEDAKKGQSPAIVRVDALGGVTLKSPLETATGRTAVYDIKARIVLLLDDVVLSREGSQVRGERLEYNLTTGMTKFDGQVYSLDGLRTNQRAIARFKTSVIEKPRS